MSESLGQGAETVPETVPETGDATVDQILAQLGGVSQRELRDQVEVFERVHGELQDFMADTAED